MITEYALPKGSYPRTIAVGHDGNLWFTNLGTNKIGQITIAGAITEYTLPSGSDPDGITPGPRWEEIWYTDYGTSKIAEITLGTL